MTVAEAKEKLIALQAKLSAYGHASGILYYDGVTTAPKGTAANRAQTLAVLSEESYKLTTGEETVFIKSGIPRSTPQKLTPLLPSLPPILYIMNRVSVSNYSRVFRIILQLLLPSGLLIR